MTLPFNWQGAAGAVSAVLDGSRAKEICLELDTRAHDKDGRLAVQPLEVYRRFSQHDLSLWCLLRGYYCLPTWELLEVLTELIGGRSALEIGSGNGALGRGLGIRRTDSYVQERPEIATIYAQLGQAIVSYGSDVERHSAAEAVERYRPAVVVGAWVTHLYDERRHEHGGNAYGVDEHAIVEQVERYVCVSHERAHGGKGILELPHQSFKPAGLVSRSMDVEGNVVWVWDRPVAGR